MRRGLSGPKARETPHPSGGSLDDRNAKEAPEPLRLGLGGLKGKYARPADSTGA